MNIFPKISKQWVNVDNDCEICDYQTHWKAEAWLFEWLWMGFYFRIQEVMHLQEWRLKHEKRIVCDGCGVEWEESFFCDCECIQEGSDTGLILMGEGDEFLTFKHPPEKMDICMNCCHCKNSG